MLQNRSATPLLTKLLWDDRCPPCADNGMLTGIDATFADISHGYSEHVWEATAPGHQMGEQASVRILNTATAEWSLNMNVQEFVF